MRRIRLLPTGVLLLGFLILAGCGDSSSPITPVTPGDVSVSVTMGDAPPAGVSVLSFEISVTKAVLQPGNIALISHPSDIEMSRLETERAFLNTTTVPAGSYSSVDVTFANPELTILNNSGSAIGSCPVGRICELRPALLQSSVTYSAAPFPMIMAADSGTGLFVDFDLLNSIQNSLAINPVISIAQLSSGAGTNHMDDVDDVVGQVTAIVTTQTFTLQVGGNTGQTLTITTDSNTRFDDFDEAGLANAFSSIAKGQLLEVDTMLTSDGRLIAKEIELNEQETGGELEGVLVSINSPSQFTIVVHDEEPDVTGVQVGNQLQVNILSGAEFDVDEDEEELAIPSGLSFHSSGDLLVGQNVQIRPLTPISGTPPVAGTNRVRLDESHLTARVQSIAGSVIIVDNLPALFTTATPAITSFEVRTSANTEFTNASGIAGLKAGDAISLSGLLFKTSASPVMVAEKVRKR